MSRVLVTSLSLALLGACGGSSAPPPTTPAPEPVATVEPEPEPPKEPEDEPEPDPPPAEVEPEFTEGMSVNDAINAVPADAPRINVEQEHLVHHIKDYNLYAGCNPKQNQKWQMHIAVWNGRAVGIDVKTDPANDEFAACVKAVIGKIEWREQVKSLNTVKYGF